MKKRLVLLAAAVLSASVLFTACGSGAKPETASMAPAAPGAGASGGANAAPARAADAAKATESKPAAANPASQSPASAQIPQEMDRKIIMNAELEIKVKDADETVANISKATKEAGGYVQETRQQGTRQQGRTTQMTLRIPAGSYENIVNLIAKQGLEALSRREWTTDVTAEYLDLDARIKTQEIHLAQLNKLYDKGGSIKEMMELEQEIARVTSDLESLKGRYRFLSNQVDFSTVTVRLYEPGAPTPIQAPKSVWERVNLEFVDSWHGVVNFTGNLVVFGAGALPVLVYLAILGAIGYGVYRGVRKNFRRPPAA